MNKSYAPMTRLLLAASALVVVAAALPAVASANQFNCAVIEVGDIYSAAGTPSGYNPRVYVTCATGGPGVGGPTAITYFAIATTDPVYVNRFLQLATAALLSGKHLYVNYNNDPANPGYGLPLNVPGCLVSNCRTPGPFSLVP